MKEKYHCCICGRENSRKRISKEYYCEKHYSEYMRYGFCITDSQRDKDDSNMIYKHEEYAEMFLYDNMQEELDQTVILDLDDYDKIKNIRWDKKQNCIVGKTITGEKLLQNVIMNTDDKVEFKDGDIFNCTKDNLFIKEEKKHKKKIHSESGIDSQNNSKQTTLE